MARQTDVAAPPATSAPAGQHYLRHQGDSKCASFPVRDTYGTLGANWPGPLAMAVNSHFISQFLLKGFASREEGNETYVYVFRKDARSFEANTKNVGTQRNFYGDPLIEEPLAEWEGRFWSLVRRLRDGDCNTNDKPLIDRFVAQTLVRTRCFRDGVHAIGSTVMERGFREFLTPERTPLLLRKLENDIINGSEVTELLQSLPVEDRPHMEILLREKLQNPGLHDVLRKLISTTLSEIDTASSVQSAQRQVLEDDRNLDMRIRNLGKVTWHVEIYPPNSLVLGDIGPLVKGGNSPEWGRIFHGTPQVIWFPLSHSRLLIGQVGDAVGTVPSEAVNLASIENSIEFFVASQRTSREGEYQKSLGSRASQLADGNLDEIQAVIREYLESPGGSLTAED